MANADDILKKYGITQVRGSEEDSEEDTSKTTYKKETSTGCAEADDILSKYGITQVMSSKSGSVQDWADEVSSLLSEAQKYFSGNWHSKDDKMYRDLQNRIDSHISQGDYWYSQYKDDDTFRSVYSALNSASNSLGNIHRYYSQWDTEDDYDRYRKYSPMSMEELYSSLGGLEVGSEEYNYVHSRASYKDDWLKEDGVTTVENASARQARYKHNTDTIAKLTAEYDALTEERKAISYQMNFGTPEYVARVDEVESKMKQIKDKIEALSAENNRYSHGQGKVDPYFGLTAKDDFADAPRTYDNITREELDRWDDIHYGTIRPNGEGKLVDIAGNVIDDNWIGYQQPVIEDKLGMFLAVDEDTRLQAYDADYEGTWATVIRDGVYRDWDKLTKDEIGIYYYLLANEGRDSAYQFLDSMTSELNRRTTAEMAERIQNAGGWEKLAWNIASVPANVLGGGMAFIDDTINTLKGEEINPYSKWHSAQNAGQVVRSATAEDINRLTNAGESDAYTWGEVYQSIMSGVDSLTGALTIGPGYIALMGMGAASAEAKELYERGASKEQIAWGGVLAGAAELVFEKVSIDHFFDSILAGGTKSPAQLIRNLLIQGGVEASEEMLTEIANTITDAMVMGSRSEFEQSIREYMEQGYTRAEASSLAVQKVGKNVWKSGIGGLISGGFMGGGAAAAQYGSYKAEVKDTGRTIMSADGGVDALKNLANQVAGVSEDTKVNGKLAKQLSKVDKKATARNVGNLYNTVQTANDLANAAANQADIAKSLQRKGFGADTAKDIAGALVARFNGQELTRHQEKLLKAVEGNEVVSKAVSDIMANEKSTMGQRSQNIRDFQSDIALGTAINTMAKQHAEKAFTPEGKYAVSSKGEATAMVTEEVDGKTVTKDSGEVIDIKGIKEIHNGKVLLDIGDGKTIDAKNVAYANQGEALVYEAIANLGDNIDADTANKLMAKFDGGNAMVFARGIAQAYTYGFYGLDRTEMRGKNTLSAELTEAQRNEAYALGEKYRPVKDAKDKAAAKATKASGEKGVYYRDKDGKTTDIRTHLDNTKIGLKDVQKTAIEVMEKMSQMMGVRFNVFESWVENGKRYYLDENGVKTEGNPNGFYDTRTGEIYIDLNAGNDFQGTMLFTIAHELTHFMRQWSPEHFTKIAKIVFQHGGMKGDVSKLVALKQAKAKARGKPISYDTAMEEVVADGMETILKDGKVLEFMEDVKKKDHAAWEKIKEWFKNFAAFLREMVSAYSGRSAQTVEGAKVAEFSSQLLNQIEQIWAEGAVTAGESYQAAKENVADAKAEKNTTEDGGVKEQARPSIKHPDKLDPRTVTREDVVTLLQMVERGEIYGDTYFPVRINTPAKLIYWAYEKRGDVIDNNPIAMSAEKAYNAMTRQGETEKGRPNRLSVPEIVSMIDSMKDPRYIVHQGVNDRYVEVVEFNTESGDTAFAVIEIGNDKNAPYMNGFEGGLYNILVTTYPPKSSQKLRELLNTKGNTVIYDKMKDAPQRTSSSTVPSVLNDASFFDDTIPDGGGVVKNESLDNTDVEIDTKTESVAPAVLKSERTWTASDYVQARDEAARDIAKAIGVTEKKAKDYIDSINSIAKMIADDRVRLDYFSSPGRSSFVGNVEYGGSFDFSTLCKKRRLLTGTFTAIQKALPNTALTANEILDIRNRMKDAGLEVSCGLCYVEGSRANMGQFAKEFLKLYKQYYPDAWQPNMADVNTPDGIEWVRINHPECYEQYEYFWNHYGTLKPGDKNLFASQQKPKLYQLHTEYKGEILEKFNDDDNVEEKNLNGGIRLQSFSDFEIVHLIDTMQIIMDMSRVGLAGQAYTKVPDFAWALGDTGLKINLSLIAKGVDANGKLIFDDVEGMPIAEAMKLRERYSKNVGTILVAFNDEQLMAAMADDRVDFIIPFHRSQWKKSQYEAMGLPAKTKDYTYMQNEKFIKPQYHEYRGRMVRDKATNYMPNEYWDFAKSGKENAQSYLDLCARNNKRPKFYKLLQNNGDGSYSLKDDGSTDGYWKLLIDFKMYDNEGNGSPQVPVKPEFNMGEATRMLNDYRGGHSNFPVAQGIVDEFVKEHKDSRKDARFSMRESVEETKDLLAYHNITAQLLLDVLKRNSLLMPSLAITNKGMTDFGEISLLFDKSTIDPTANSANKLYGADAWTPTQTELKKNAKFDTDKTVRAVNTVKNRIGSKFTSQLFDVSPKQFKDEILKADGSIYNAYAHNLGMQTAYATEKGIISKIPTYKDGTLNKTALQEQLNAELDTDNGWRQYKKWLRGISDDIITSYDRATNEEILRDMKAQPATAKTFKLTETGELVVPAAEYADIDTLRENKDRLSENAQEATKAVADAFLSLARKIDGNTKAVVNAINATFANRYSVADIVRSFSSNGIKISAKTASELQSLYKQAVELPTQYFEAKPGREVGLDEIKAVVMPTGTEYAELKGKLEAQGVSVVEYDGSKASRVEALNSMESLKFSERDTANKLDALNETAALKTVRFSPREYSKTVDAIVYSDDNAPFDYRNVYMGETPQALLDIGFIQLPMTITSKHIYTIANKDGRFSSPNDHYHELGATRVKELPEMVREPVATFVEKDNPRRVVIVTSKVDPLGLPIMVAVEYSGQTNYNEVLIYANPVTTALGKKDSWFESQIKEALQDGRMLQADKKRSQESPSGLWAQCPESLWSSDFTANIEQFKQNVKRFLPKEKQIRKAWNAVRENEGTTKSSERTDDSVSNRALLANALEGLAKDETERNKIQEYKGKIDLVNAEERKLRELNEQIKELSFAKGPRDTAKISQLRDEATKTANRISIYDKQLLRLEASAPLQKVLEREKKKAYQRAEKKGKEALAEYKAEAEAKQKETTEKWRESRKKAVENRNMAFVRGKIKNFKAKLEHTLLQPTDRQYVPIDLIKAMVEVCELIDTDTDLYKADGSINKAQQKRDETKEKLQNLKDEYEKLKTNSDPIYAGEFDEMVYTYLAELRDKFSGKSIKDMSLDDLSEMYEILVAIDETLRDARKLIGWGDAETVYDAGDSIVAEQDAIQQKRKNGKRNAAQKAFDELNNLGLSPVRNVEKMSGYNQDSSLLKLFKRFEEGIRKKNRFVMESYKMFEELASSKEYDDAVYNEVAGKKYIDHNGLEFGLSKMQMMQAILSWEREAANMDLKHIQKGGFTFADLGMLRKGKLKESVDAEYTHRVPNAVDLVAEFQETLKDDKWCQDYMAVARKFFNEKAKDAINETSISLKHRIIAKGKNYIPFEVDTSFVNMEITDINTVQKTINGYGMLKDTKNSAPQPLYITGLNNIIDRHIDQVGNVYGLAIEVRNFNKVWNVKSTTESGKDVTVNSIIEENWGKKGIAHIEQTVKDIQGSRVRDRSWLYDRVKSGYIGSTFLLNLSVVTKQNGSLFSATSMIKWRDPVRMLANLYWTMLNRKKISAEVDKYTATAWMRRQGMSDAEVYTLATEAKKTKLGRWFSNAPAIINPAKWITARDHAVALSLWKYCKQDTAKKTGLTGTELLEATAKFYDEVIENTQSMTDVLHRPEIQKSGKILHESFAMFKTDLYQMAGQLHNTTGRFLANKNWENGKALGRTLYAVAMSAIWGSLMTTVFAMLRYKVNPYRDDDDEELTAESWLKRQLFGLGGDIMGYIFPVFGSEAVGMFESIMYGESEDIADSLALTAINDLYTTMLTIGTSIKDGEMPDASNMKKLVTKSLQCFGIPANNILRALEAIRLHAEDIANGEFLSFEAGVERTSANHIHRIIEAMDEGNADVSMGLYEEALDDLATRKAKGGEYGKDEIADAKSDLKTALGKKYKTGDVSKNTATKILSTVFGMSKDDIYWQFDAWDYAKENESADDYAKYGDFYAAVETGKNLRFTIKVYTDNGVSTETLSGQITSHFKPIYSEMSKSKRAGLKGYLLNAYELCGMSRADAEEKIAKWEFEADHPELGDKITYTQYKRWEADGKPKGVSVDLFVDVAEFRDDGTSDSVKSQDEVKQYIMSVASDRQTRHALWCCFYKASTSPWR